MTVSIRTAYTSSSTCTPARRSNPSSQMFSTKPRGYSVIHQEEIVPSRLSTFIQNHIPCREKVESESKTRNIREIRPATREAVKRLGIATREFFRNWTQNPTAREHGRPYRHAGSSSTELLLPGSPRINYSGVLREGHDKT